MIGFAAALIFFFPGVFFQGRVLINSDMHQCHFAWAYYFKDTINKGIFALWNKGSFCGGPFGSGVLSNLGLLNIFIWLIPNAPASWNVYILLSLFSIAAVSYVYSCEIGFSRPAAFLTGLIYTFAHTGAHYNEDNLGVFLPLSLWCVERFFKVRKPRYLFFSFLSLLVPCVSVLPQFSFYLCIFFIVYVWLRSRSWMGIGIVALVVGTISFYLFRLFEFLVNSVRGQLWFVTVLLPMYLVCFIFPFFFESTFRPEPNFFFQKIFLEVTQSLLHTDKLTYIFPPYLSILGITFVAWGWRQKGIIRIFRGTALFILFYWMANPLIAPIMKHIPILAQLPRISRLGTLLTFSLAILAGAGFDRVLKKDFNFKPAVLFYGILVSVLGGFLLVLRLGTRLGGPWIRSFAERYIQNNMLTNPNYTAGDEFYLKRIDDFFKFINQWTNLLDLSFSLPVLLIVLSLALVWFWRKKAISRNIFVFAVCVLISFDLMIFFKLRIYSMPTLEQVRYETEGIKFLQRDKSIFRIMQILDDVVPGQSRERTILTPNLPILYGLESVEGYDPLFIGRYQTFFRNFQPDYDKDNAMIFAGPEGNFQDEVADFLNVKYYVTPKEKILRKKLPFVAEDEKIKIYNNPDYQERAFIVHETKVIEDDAKILSFLKSDQMNFRKMVVLEGEPKPFSGGENNESNSDQAVIDLYEPNKISMTVKTDKSGFLVVSNNFYPGWIAFVDHQPVKIYRANYTFQAIQIPAGTHQVEFLFRPKSFTLGAMISVFFLILSPFACSAIGRALKPRS